MDAISPNGTGYSIIQYLKQPDAVLIPGHRWFRVRTGSSQPLMEELTDGPLPLRHQFEHFAVSSQFGLVAWNQGDQFFQVLIDEPVPEDQDLAARYPNVPASHRSRHHAAVERIRKCGGSVDTRFSKTYSQIPYAWQTCVFLPAEWSGDDEDFAALSDLYQVDDIRIVRANVSAEALKTLGQIKSLEILALVETQATDELLPHLADLQKLMYLHLEGPVGSLVFTDAGLKPLPRLRRLRTVSLYGPGFTSDAVDPLSRIRQLRYLKLAETGLTSMDRQKLRQKKGSAIQFFGAHNFGRIRQK